MAKKHRNSEGSAGVRGARPLLGSMLVALIAAGCALVEPGGSGSGGGGGWPAPSPTPSPGPGWPSPGYRTAHLVAEPAPLDFGAVEVGRAVDLECVVSNRGGADAEVLAVELSGRDLRVVADSCSGRRIGPGAACAFRVRCAPRDPGPISGAASVVASGPAQRRLQIAVMGTARPLRRSDVDLRFQPAQVFFGEVDLGGSADAGVAIRNAGDEPVRLQDVTVDGREFEIRQNGCGGELLRPGRDCRVGLVYRPAWPGRASGAMRVRPAGAPGGLVLSVPLAGEGRDRRGPEMRLSVREINFGAVPVGEARSEELRIANSGRRELRLRALKVVGRGFSLASDGCSGRTLAPGRDCAVAVRFSPLAAGGVDGRVEIASDGRDDRGSVVSLAGSGRQVQRCPQVGVKLRWERDRDPAPLVVSGQLPPGECVTYGVEIKRPGRLIVCVPPGYDLTAKGFEFVKGSDCKVGSDPAAYRRYRRLGIEGGTAIKDLTLRRNDKARKEYKVQFEFRGLRPGARADDGD